MPIPLITPLSFSLFPHDHECPLPSPSILSLVPPCGLPATSYRTLPSGALGCFHTLSPFSPYYYISFPQFLPILEAQKRLTFFSVKPHGATFLSIMEHFNRPLISHKYATRNKLLYYGIHCSGFAVLLVLFHYRGKGGKMGSKGGRKGGPFCSRHSQRGLLRHCSKRIPPRSHLFTRASLSFKSNIINNARYTRTRAIRRAQDGTERRR